MMKFYITLPFFLLSISHAQAGMLTDVQPSYEKVTMGKKEVYAWVMPVGNSPETVRKSFTRYSKEQLALKVKVKGKDMAQSEMASISQIAVGMGSLWMKVWGYGQVNMAIAYVAENGMELDRENHPEEMERLKTLLKKFALYHEKRYFIDLLKENKKRLTALGTELSKTENQVKSLNSRVRKIEKSITKTGYDKEKFNLGNKNIENRAKVQAMYDIIGNLKKEIVKFSRAVDSITSAIRKLETQTYEVGACVFTCAMVGPTS